MQVRVWWPPGAPGAAARQSAAFHTATALRTEADGTYVLEYAGGDTKTSPSDCVFPYENPVSFGGEEIPARVRTAHPPVPIPPAVSATGRIWPERATPPFPPVSVSRMDCAFTRQHQLISNREARAIFDAAIMSASSILQRRDLVRNTQRQVPAGHVGIPCMQAGEFVEVLSSARSDSHTWIALVLSVAAFGCHVRSPSRCRCIGRI